MSRMLVILFLLAAVIFVASIAVSARRIGDESEGAQLTESDDSLGQRINNTKPPIGRHKRTVCGCNSRGQYYCTCPEYPGCANILGSCW
ncbi:hypothetical protein WR25_22304 [Diploscapter pachys]|uniref:EGF-like domain-containing protein n=1 Tax=Diploscapter pachys TaxID=2018661 RepID=A0A2A2JTY0_9BILA|nr:hypothetical protein WR25_22304 [Diploscapter pachys]